MKRWLAAVLFSLAAATAGASEHGNLMHAKVDVSDANALQRGARVFVNYCLSCHSAEYMRFSRAAADMQLPDSVAKQNLLFVAEKTSATMKVAMRPTDGANWFGVMPPDLSVIARSRGADYLYSYLLTYYDDPKRPTGVNNLTYPNTAMPHVLWELQGMQRLVADEGHGHGTGKLELRTAGTLSEEDYRSLVNDLVTFLVYMAEPAQLERQRLGVWVLLFLIGFTALAYLLKKEYWRDVH